MFKLQVAAIFIIVLLSFPFFFSSFLGSNYIVFIIKIIALLFLAFTGKVKISNRMALIIVAFIFYLLVYTIKNFNYFQGMPDYIFYFLFGIVIWSLMQNNLALREYFLRRWLTFMTIICSSTIICGVLFLTTGTTFFIARTINDYELFFNPLIGALNLGRIRPEWYFSEPNYLGTFLALCVPVLISYFPRLSNWKRFIFGALLLYTTILVNSYGALLALGIGLIGYIFYRLLHINGSIFQLAIIVGVVSAVLIVPNYDTSDMRSDYEEIASSSLNDRQERTADSKTILANMDIADYLFGRGLNSVSELTGKGTSMVYYTLIIEWGLFFTLIFFTAILTMLRENFLTQLILLANFFCTEAFLNPLLLLSLFIICLGTKDKNPKITKERIRYA